MHPLPYLTAAISAVISSGIIHYSMMQPLHEQMLARYKDKVITDSRSPAGNWLAVTLEHAAARHCYAFCHH